MKYWMLLAVAVCSSVHAEVYKCTEGKRVHYQAQPCADAQTQQQLETPPQDIEKQKAALAAANASNERWQQQREHKQRETLARMRNELRLQQQWQRQQYRLLQQQRKIQMAEEKAQRAHRRSQARFNSRRGMPRHIFDRPHLTD